jgi:hypothetical protein
LSKLVASIALTAVVLMIGLINSSEATLLSEVKTTTIRVLPADQAVEDENSVCDLHDVYMNDLSVRDLQGNVITETTAGSQVILETSVANTCDQHKPLFVILEVRDSDGYTIFLTWQNSTINANEQVANGISWVAPDLPGEYAVRGFYMGCFNCLGIIDNIKTYYLTVLP